MSDEELRRLIAQKMYGTGNYDALRRSMEGMSSDALRDLSLLIDNVGQASRGLAMRNLGQFLMPR